MRNSFVMYTDYLPQIMMLDMEQRGLLLTAVMAYVSDSDMPELDAVTNMCFGFIRSNLDKDADKYEKVVEARREAGKQGGRPKANGFSEKAKKANGLFEKQTKAKKADNDNDNDSENDNENVSEKETSPKGDAKKKRFAPPTLEELKAYISEHGYNVDAERFMDYYESNGWIVGKSHMKDWKAAVRNWSRNQRQGTTANGGQGSTAQTRFNNFPQRSYDFDELEAQILAAQEKRFKEGRL